MALLYPWYHPPLPPHIPTNFSTPTPQHMLSSSQMSCPITFPNLALTHFTFNFQLAIFLIIRLLLLLMFFSSFFFAQLSLHPKPTLQVAFSTLYNSSTLRHPHFLHCFFSTSSTPFSFSLCFLVFRCFAHPNFLILCLQTSQYISLHFVSGISSPISFIYTTIPWNIDDTKGRAIPLI